MDSESAVRWAKAFMMASIGVAALLIGWSSTVKVVNGERGYTRNALTGEFCYRFHCRYTDAK